VLPISLVLSWPLCWLIQKFSLGSLRPLVYRLGLLVFGGAFTVLLGVWYSTQMIGWLLAVVVVGLSVNCLAFLGTTSSSNSALLTDAYTSPLRGQHGAAKRER
jgi:hypothetical protein